MAAKDLSSPGPKESPKRRCSARKKDGTPCRKPPIIGGTVCMSHGGAAKHIREAARNRLLASQDWLMAELLRIAKSSKNDSVKLKAIRDALDRAGLSARQEVHIEGKVSLFDELFADGVVVITDDVSAEDAAAIAAFNAEGREPTPEPIESTPSLRALPSARETGEPGKPLEGVVIPSEKPTGSVRIPRHVAEGLRRQGYDI